MKKKALLLEAHQKGCSNATLLLALQIDMRNLNIYQYITATINYLELLITAVTHENADAAFILAEQYEKDVNAIIFSFTFTNSSAFNYKIGPCTEKEWIDYREMKANATRAMSDRYFELGRTYKQHFSARNCETALNARKEKIIFLYEKACTRGIFQAKRNLELFKERDLKAEVKRHSIYPMPKV